MKSFVLLILALVTLAFSKHSVSFHPAAHMITQNIYSMGTQTEYKGRKNVQTIALVKTIDGSQAYGIAPEMEGFTELSCCSFISPGSRWREPADFIVDPSNPQGLSESFVMNAISAATSAWDTQVTFSIYNSLTQQPFEATPAVTSPDGLNVKFFADLNNIGGLDPDRVIAVTFLHGVFGGIGPTNEILEADVVYNTVFPFGDGTLNSGVMDLQAIAAHEEGHVCGLGHSSTVSTCADVTMFPTAVYGETKKRSPEEDDATCIRVLYEEPGFDGPEFGGPGGNNFFASSASKTTIGVSTLLLVLSLNLI